ncbi:uncharacterized protein LOC110852270 isoform X2 [Folsomia candida]|uniref:uncharacterized protein LOC110852270 isoform X2 n=1 Tax=Folsomia candida TaxID=158441 RepID=UPI0016051A58|nr:uncharacterized protein LOC110852270 isoform X2 [Folsomia candida]
MNNSDEGAPERGTAAGIASVFKIGQNMFGMSAFTEADFKKVDQESKKFGKAKSGKTNPKKKTKKKTSPPKVLKPDKDLTTSAYDDVDEFLKEHSRLLGIGNDDELHSEHGRKNSTPSTDLKFHLPCNKTNRKLNSPPTDLVSTVEIDLGDDEDENNAILDDDASGSNTVINLDDSQSYLGVMLGFSVSLGGAQISVMMYESEFVSDLRKKIAHKAKIADPESLQMFFENTILEDTKTIKESGILMCCNIDAFMLEKTDQELFNEESETVVQFKMQTGDRRGRQNCYIYAKKSSTVRMVRDKYASEMDFNPSDIKLMRDGEILILDSLIKDLEDLEREDSIDVIIKNE